MTPSRPSTTAPSIPPTSSSSPMDRPLCHPVSSIPMLQAVSHLWGTFQALVSLTLLTPIFEEGGSCSIPSELDDSTEYFFALAPVPQPPGYGAFTKAEVVEFTSGSPDVAASLVYFTSTVVNPNATNNGQFINILKQVAFWRFDEKGAVLKYDAWIPNLRLYGSVLTPDAGPGTVAPPPPEVQASFIQTFCGTTQQLCKGTNTQYNSTGDCVRILSQRRFGDLDNIWDDSVTCRRIHILLARIRPEVGPDAPK